MDKCLYMQCLQTQTRLYPLGSGASWLPRWLRARRLAKGVIYVSCVLSSVRNQVTMVLELVTGKPELSVGMNQLID